MEFVTKGGRILRCGKQTVSNCTGKYITKMQKRTFGEKIHDIQIVQYLSFQSLKINLYIPQQWLYSNYFVTYAQENTTSLYTGQFSCLVVGYMLNYVRRGWSLGNKIAQSTVLSWSYVLGWQNWRGTNPQWSLGTIIQCVCTILWDICTKK